MKNLRTFPTFGSFFFLLLLFVHQYYSPCCFFLDYDVRTSTVYLLVVFSGFVF